MISMLNDAAHVWAAWMWPMFWQSTLLILLVAAVDRLLCRWAHPQMRMALWLLVAVKLILPPTLPSPISLTAPLLDSPSLTISALSDLINEPAGSDGAAAPVKTALSPVHDAATHNGMALSASTAWMLVWFAGVVVFSIYLIQRYRRMRREVLIESCGERVTLYFVDLASRAAGRLGLGRLPRIVLCRRVSGPAVFGFFKPVILLPHDIAERLSAVEIEHVLLHELAHIKRRDLVIHTLILVVQIVYWFFPPLWFAGRRIRALRELCCDATVATSLEGSTEVYRKTLLQVAYQMLYQPSHVRLGFLGLLVEPSNILSRLRWLQRNAALSSRRRRIVIGLVVLAMLVCVVPMARAKGLHRTQADQTKTTTDPLFGKQILDQLAGSWNAVTRLRMAPQAPVIESEGRCTNRWVLDRQFMIREFEGQSWTGQPFEGMSILGYNPLKEQFVSVWADTLGTTLLKSEGSCDDSGAVITFLGHFQDPLSGEEKQHKTVLSIENELRCREEMFEINTDGTEHKTFEVIYTRRDS